MPETVAEMLALAGAVATRGYTFLDVKLVADSWSFARIAEEARRRAGFFASRGLRKGDRMGLVVSDSKEFVLSFFGAILAGVVPVPLFPPVSLGRFKSYVESAQRILRAAGARCVLATSATEPALAALVERVPLERLWTVEEMGGEGDAWSAADLPRIDPEDVCFIQFTSGSTSDPKGVVVTHANLVANARAIMIDGLRSDPERDVGVSWLPLYHDMGLIGFVVAPMIVTTPVVFIPTTAFARRPHVWLSTISKYRGTITFAPNFAFDLAARRAQRAGDLDLRCLRAVGCAAEPIRADTLREFLAAYEPWGLRREAIMPSYGLAEATLAVSFDPLDRPFHSIRVDERAYVEEQRALPREPSRRAIELVACGRPFPGHEIRIARDGANVGDGCVGEIHVRGPSVCRAIATDRGVTEDLAPDGWLHTGDLGFVIDGSLYLSGRRKDLVILHGRNYYPQDIEWEVEQVAGIRAGTVVAFSSHAFSSQASSSDASSSHASSSDASSSQPSASHASSSEAASHAEALVVTAETGRHERALVALEVNRRLHEALGIQARSVVLVSPGSIPKTSSGKVQRRKVKDLFERGAWPSADAVTNEAAEIHAAGEP